MKDTILHILSLRNGIRAVDLALDVMERVNPQRFSTEEYHRVIEDCIQSGNIKELEYYSYNEPRVKSIFFSKETVFIKKRSLEDGDSSEDSMDRKSTSHSQVSRNKT